MCQGHGAMLARTRASFGAAVEFVTAAAKVENEEFREAISQLALQGLTAMEGHGQRCAQFLLSALQHAASAGAAAMHDTMWMLQRLALKSESSKAWILEARGAEILHSALLAAHTDDKFGQEGAWLAYYLDGLRGLADLLCRSRASSTADHVSVRVAVAWVVFELVKEERKDIGSQPKAESASVLAVLLEAMGHESTTAEGQWACVAALDAMVKCEARLGVLFIERGGARLLIRALRAALAMGHEGEEFRRAVAFLLSSLSDGCLPAANALRAEGAIHVLADVCCQGTGRDVDAALWALGALGGVAVVLEAMIEQGPARPWVVRGGMVALCECAYNATGDGEELKRLPTALSMLLGCMAQEEAKAGSSGGSRWLTECTAALGGVLSSLAPHVPPGRMADFDRGMEALLKRMQATPALRSPAPIATRAPPPSAMAGAGAGAGPEGDIEEEEQMTDANHAAEKAAEAVGRVALAAPDWRQALRSCGALDALASWIRCGGAPRRLQKYLFWAAGAIAGLPFVANELRNHVTSFEVVDAALCAIIAILDDDIDGEYALVGAESCADSDVPAVIHLVVEAMRQHPGTPQVQAKGSHCLGLLVPLAPAPQAAASSSAAAVAAAAPAVVQAARRFPRRRDVANGSAMALRALFTLSPMYAGAAPASQSGVYQDLARALSAEGATDCAAEALDAWGESRFTEELLENSAAALALGAGIEPVLQRLAMSTQGTPLREAGVKALFEVAQQDITVLASSGVVLVQQAAELCARFAAEEECQHEQRGRVREVAELLAGLCGRAPQVA